MTAEKELEKLAKVLLELDGQFKAAIEAAYKEGWNDSATLPAVDAIDFCKMANLSWLDSESKETIDSSL